jgi:hypothetical protein
MQQICSLIHTKKACLKTVEIGVQAKKNRAAYAGGQQPLDLEGAQQI